MKPRKPKVELTYKQLKRKLTKESRLNEAMMNPKRMASYIAGFFDYSDLNSICRRIDNGGLDPHMFTDEEFLKYFGDELSNKVLAVWDENY